MPSLTLTATLALSTWFLAAHSHPLESIGRSSILTRQEDVKSEYDYVVVGGGTAGLVVADRLSESGDSTVLVIELGYFDNGTSVTTVTGGANGFQNASHLFSFPSTPQVGLNNRTTNVVGGVMLGGSSGVNGLQVHRGMRNDYDSWGSFFSNSSGWSWDGLLPYFKKAWSFHAPDPELVDEFDINYDESFWGNTSGIHASFPTFYWPMLKYEMAAHAEIDGVEFPPDSGAGLPGAFWYPTSADPAAVTRSMARMGHWDGAHERENYDTITGQRALRVLFNGGIASGVSFVSAQDKNDANARSVSVKKEVIIAAGTIHTPQLLQASGIGAKPLLNSANIAVVADLPGVGANFQDHTTGGAATFSLRNFTIDLDPNDLYQNLTFRNAAQAEWNANRTGPLSIASGNAASFLPLPVIAPDSFEDIAARFEAQDAAAYLPWDVDDTIIAGYEAQKAALAAAFRSKGSAVYNFFFRGSNSESAHVFLHPTSRGTVTINTDDPFFSQPIVDYRALTNPTDVDILAEFTHFTRRYWLETSLKAFNPVETAPGADLETVEELEGPLRRTLSPTCFHPVGTAAMLPRELGGVVDEKLEVYGVERLSVVDASIIPMLPGAYTQQTVYAVAEKAADLIKARA